METSYFIPFTFYNIFSSYNRIIASSIIFQFSISSKNAVRSEVATAVRLVVPRPAR